MFWTYQSLKKLVGVSKLGGGGRGVVTWWPIHGLVCLFENFAIVDLEMTFEGFQDVISFFF